jgi:hypothetical protein
MKRVLTGTFERYKKQGAFVFLPDRLGLTERTAIGSGASLPRPPGDLEGCPFYLLGLVKNCTLIPDGREESNFASAASAGTFHNAV